MPTKISIKMIPPMEPPLTPGASGGAGPFSHRPRHNHAISAARSLLAGRPFGRRIAVMLRKVLKIAAAA
jgi:hypothetical protein